MEKMSSTLRQRIDETKSDITALEARRAAIVAEKQAVLGAATVDPKMLVKVEQEAAKIPVSLESLHTRLSLLAGQVEEAEAREAVARVAEIETQYRDLARTVADSHAEWVAGIARLMTLAN